MYNDERECAGSTTMTTGPRLKRAKNEPVILQGSTLARIEATDLGTADGEKAALWLSSGWSRMPAFFKEIGFSERR